MSDSLLTPADLGDRLNGVPAKTVLELRRRYGWPYVLLGKRIRFTVDQAEAIVRMQTRTAKPITGLPGQTEKSASRSH